MATEYLNEPVVHHRKELAQIAAAYHEQCEQFDRLVCTGPIIDGAILPASALENAAIQRNAKESLRIAMDKAARLGISETDVRRAISTKQPA